MDLIEECVMLKGLSDENIQSVCVNQDFFAIGVLLACPLEKKGLALMEALLKISACEVLDDRVRTAALAKFYRHLAEIHNVINVHEEFALVSKLVNAASKVFTLVIALKSSERMGKYLAKCLNGSVERLVFEFRTKVQVVDIVEGTQELLHLIQPPSDLFKCSPSLLVKIKEFFTQDLPTEIQVIQELCRQISDFKSKDTDPIKNIGLILTSHLFTKIDNSNSGDIIKILTDFSIIFNKTQKAKLLNMYTQYCKNWKIPPDTNVNKNLNEVVDKPESGSSAWDFIDEGQSYYFQSEIIPVENYHSSDLESVINDLKKKFFNGFLPPDTIKYALIQYQKENQGNIGQVLEKILGILEKEDARSRKFWGVMMNGIKRTQIFNSDQVYKISNKVNTLDKSSYSQFPKGQSSGNIEEKGFRRAEQPAEVKEDIEAKKVIKENTQIIEEKVIKENTQIIEEKVIKENTQVIEEKVIEENRQIAEEKVIEENRQIAEEKFIEENSQIAEELDKKMSEIVQKQVPGGIFFRDLEIYLKKFSEALKSKFPNISTEIVGSLHYKLYIGSSPIDLQITTSEPSERSELQALILSYLSSIDKCEVFPHFLKYSSKYTLHIYINTLLPSYTSSLISTYNCAPEINIFLCYVKIWSNALNFQSSGYFWTLISLFYLFTSTPPVLENLQQPEIHIPIALEGCDVWLDSRPVQNSLKNPGNMFIEFINFLSGQLGNFLNIKTCDTVQTSEHSISISDIFTEKVLGIELVHFQYLQEEINRLKCSFS